MSKPISFSGPLLGTINDLSAGKIDVSSHSNSLQFGLTALLQRYEAREKKYEEAVKKIQDNYNNVVKEAEQIADEMKAAAAEEAKKLIAAAKVETEAWEAEKAKLAVIQKFEPRIKLDVGGERFTTSLTTLTRFPDTMIGAMFSGRHALPLDAEGYHFIDRDGTHFRYILNFLRSPDNVKIEITGAALSELKGECDYYGLLDLMFPFIPVPEFSVSNPWGQMVSVKQGQDGIFIVNSKPIHVCTLCFAGDYSQCGITGHNGYYLQNFTSTVTGKNGTLSPDQPKPPVKCPACRRAN